jgi:hypothetical protein
LLPEFRILLNVLFLLLTLHRLIEFDAELNALKGMVENTVVFFYPGESSTTARAPQLLDDLSTRSRVVILVNMK